MAACAAGYSNVALELIRKGAVVDARDSSTGRTAAYLAAMGGHITTLEILFDAGADILQVAASGASLLFAAIGGGHSATARWLIARSGGALLTMPGDEKESPIGLAISLGSSELLDALLDAHVDPNRRCGDTYPLPLAAAMQRTEALERLINAGADLEICLPDGRTTLLIAASKGATPIVDILLRHGASLDAAHQGMSALWLAVAGGHVDTAARLIAAGADLECVDSQGYRPTWLAAFNGRPDIIALLLNAGAAINEPDSAQGTTPLTAAASAGRGECVDMLLQRGADVDKVIA
jgi:ankyrin repeat protein